MIYGWIALYIYYFIKLTSEGFSDINKIERLLTYKDQQLHIYF